VETARRILERDVDWSEQPEAEDYRSRVSETIGLSLTAMGRIVARERSKTVPLLFEYLDAGPRRPSQSNQVRIGAVNWLRSLGRDAREAYPALVVALESDDSRFRGYVEEALDELAPFVEVNGTSLGSLFR
jgi:hypothetical protein